MGHCDAALPLGVIRTRTRADFLTAHLRQHIAQFQGTPCIVRHGTDQSLTFLASWFQRVCGHSTTWAPPRPPIVILFTKPLWVKGPSHAQAGRGPSHATCHLLPQVGKTSLSVLCPLEWRGQVTTTGSTRTAASRVPTPKGWSLGTNWANLPSGVLGYVGVCRDTLSNEALCFFSLKKKIIMENFKNIQSRKTNLMCLPSHFNSYPLKSTAVPSVPLKQHPPVIPKQISCICKNFSMYL